MRSSGLHSRTAGATAVSQTPRPIQIARRKCGAGHTANSCPPLPCYSMWQLQTTYVRHPTPLLAGEHRQQPLLCTIALNPWLVCHARLSGFSSKQSWIRVDLTTMLSLMTISIQLKQMAGAPTDICDHRTKRSKRGSREKGIKSMTLALPVLGMHPGLPHVLPAMADTSVSVSAVPSTECSALTTLRTE